MSGVVCVVKSSNAVKIGVAQGLTTRMESAPIAAAPV